MTKICQKIFRFSQFLADSSTKLNNLDSYDQLKHRASRNGYKIISINYTGYTSSDTLQAMQDDAIQSRTQMRLNAETEKQKNELSVLKLEGKNRRLALESELGSREGQLTEKLSNVRAKFKIDSDEAKNETDLKLVEFETRMNEKVEAERLRIDHEYLEKLKELGVDVERYQTELNRSKNKVDTVYHLI
jgi:hypothetical protein